MEVGNLVDIKANHCGWWRQPGLAVFGLAPTACRKPPLSSRSTQLLLLSPSFVSASNIRVDNKTMLSKLKMKIEPILTCGHVVSLVESGYNFYATKYTLLLGVQEFS